ncbi:MAG: WD40 repeat domain-containing protein [Chloroflexi bacterium]|nr:WD40 repeat domain-containing protein [Chloroflexota bacterium]
MDRKAFARALKAAPVIWAISVAACGGSAPAVPTNTPAPAITATPTEKAITAAAPAVTAPSPTGASLPTETPVALITATAMPATLSKAPEPIQVAATCRMPDLDERTPVRQSRKLKSPTSDNTYVAYSPDGKTLASASSYFGSGTLVLWDVKTGKKLHEHSGSLFRPVFSRDGKMLAFWTTDLTVVLWDVRKWEEISTIKNDTDQGFWSAAFSPDGKTLLTGDAGYRVKLWDIATGQKVMEYGDGHDIGSTTLSFNPDGTAFVSGGQFISTKLWNVASGEEMGEAEQSSFNAVTFSPNGTLIAGGNTASQVVLWDGETLGTVSEIDMGNDDQVYAVAFSPDGAWVAAGGHASDPPGQPTIRFWDVGTGTEDPSINYTAEVNSIAFSPDCRTMASGDDSGNIIIWRIGK